MMNIPNGFIPFGTNHHNSGGLYARRIAKTVEAAMGLMQ
jgi:hypothetical protein